MARGGRDGCYDCTENHRRTEKDLCSIWPSRAVSLRQRPAAQFASFMKMNGIKHIRCSLYHPSSNGAAERFVQTFKKAMKAGLESTPSQKQQLANFLLTYRSTPHATTNQAPSQLFMGRGLRTRLDLLRPDCNRRVCDQQAMQKAGHDRHSCPQKFHVGQNVMAKNLRPGAAWVPGVVAERLGPLSYLVQVK